MLLKDSLADTESNIKACQEYPRMFFIILFFTIDSNENQVHI